MGVTEQKKIVMIAGPNGAGKTTFAREFLPIEASLPLFINADLIAAGLSPFRPELAAIRAGRLMLEEIDRNAAAGLSFAFETTLAGHTYARRIPEWRAGGYLVKLIFLSLNAGRCDCARGRQGAAGWPRRLGRRHPAAVCERHDEFHGDLSAISRLLAVV